MPRLLLENKAAVSTKFLDVEPTDAENYFDNTEQEEPIYTIKRFKSDNNKCTPIIVDVQIENKNLKMQFDTGSPISIISKEIWEHIGKPKLAKGPKVNAYGGTSVKVLGICDVFVIFRGNKQKLDCGVVDNDEVPLFGLS